MHQAGFGCVLRSILVEYVKANKLALETADYIDKKFLYGRHVQVPQEEPWRPQNTEQV